MSKVPYLISILKRKYLQSGLDKQINIFEIINQSSDQILDSTLDYNFVDYMLSNDPSLIVDNNNRLYLSDAQLKKYIGARMYYYNPRLLDAVIFNLFNVQLWIDMQDFRQINDKDSAGRIISFVNKQSADEPNRVLTSLDSNSRAPFVISELNNFAFSGLMCDDGFDSYTPSFPTTLAPTQLTDPFTLIFCGLPGDISELLYLYQSGDPSSCKGISFGCYINGSTLHVITTCYYELCAELYQNLSFSIDTSDPVRLVITCDGINFYVYANDCEVQSFAVPSSSLVFSSERFLFCDPNYGQSFSGCLFDFILSNDYCTASAVETIMSYLTTKYFIGYEP